MISLRSGLIGGNLAAIIFQLCQRLARSRSSAPAYSDGHIAYSFWNHRSRGHVFFLIDDSPDHRRLRGDPAPFRSLHPGHWRSNCRHRTMGCYYSRRRPMEFDDPGNVGWHRRNDRAGCLVHRCQTLRTKTHRRRSEHRRAPKVEAPPMTKD